jgi:hypothetical protein
MSAPVEWDWPEEPQRARRVAPRVHIERPEPRDVAKLFRPQRSLGAPIWSGYARLIIAVIVTAFTLAAFGLLVMLLRL